jgi:outer membrane protein assembly factor BamB
MERKNLLWRMVSKIVLALLLVNTIAFTGNSLVKEVAASDGGSIDSWPMFRHYADHTGYSVSNISSPIVSLKNETSAAGFRSSPSADNDSIYACNLDGYVFAWWAKPPYGNKWPLGTKYGSIYSSPAVAENMVFFGSYDKNIYALSALNGTQIWNFPTGDVVKSSPVISKGVLYIGSCDGYVYALNASSTRQELWRYRTVYAVESSPAVFNDTIFFGANDGRVYALEESGRYKWKYVTGGPVISSPAVTDDMVFVGSNDTNVYALNITTGEKIWNYTTGGPVTSSPAIGYDMVFVGSSDTHVYALNITTGEQIWNYTTGGPVHSSPALTANEEVIVGSADGSIYVLNLTGGCIWSRDTGGPIFSSPAIAKGLIIVGSDNNQVYIFAGNRPPVANFSFTPGNPIVTGQVAFDGSLSSDPDENETSDKPVGFYWNFDDGKSDYGKPKVAHSFCAARIYNVTLTVVDKYAQPDTTWQLVKVTEAWPMFRHDPTHVGCSTSQAPVRNVMLWPAVEVGLPVSEDQIYPSPAVVGDLVFVCFNNITTTSGAIYAINATNGMVKWGPKVPAPGYRIYSSPAFVNGSVYVGCEDGKIYCWNANDGTAAAPIPAGYPHAIYSSPAFNNGCIVVSSGDGYVYSVNITAGMSVRKSPMQLGTALYSSPAIANGTIFVGSYNGKLYALDESTLNVKWTYQTNGEIRSSPAVACNTVFVGSRDNNIYAIDINANTSRWSYTTDGYVDSSPAVVDGIVFVGSRDGNLYALNATDRKEVWPHKPIGTIRWSSPTVAEGKVFVGSTAGKIYALSVVDGSEVWSFQTGGAVESSPAVLDNTLYVSSQNGSLYAFSSWVHDVAVSNVTATPPSVIQGRSVTITFEVENEGSYNESIDVTVDYNGTIINNTSVSLTHGNRTTLIVPWDTSSVTPGNYTISANATIEIDDHPEDNSANCNVTVRGPEHDVAIVNVTTSKTGCTLPNGTLMPTVGGNYSTWVNVTIENHGDFNETFNVYLFANSTPLKSWTITLANGESTRRDFNWSLEGYPKGNYTIGAVAELASDDHPADNNFTDCWITVTIDGDVNGDGKVDVKDVFAVAKAYGSVKPPAPSPPGHPWNPNCDINDDGKVDLKDYYIVNKRYGSADP